MHPHCLLTVQKVFGFLLFDNFCRKKIRSLYYVHICPPFVKISTFLNLGSLVGSPIHLSAIGLFLHWFHQIAVDLLCVLASQDKNKRQ